MDILEIYRRHGVHYQTEGDRHTTRGWVNCRCPFCTGSPGLHLGFNLQHKFFRCWRCGWHSTVDTLIELCRVSSEQARQLYYELGASGGPFVPRVDKTSRLINLSRYKRPTDVGPLRPSHKRYLAGRGFDPEKIEAEWHVCSTGPLAYLDNIDYRYRLFIPIVWNDREVSFQCRDVTGKSDIKYRACPLDREAMHHKNILYGRPDCWGSRVGIAVEGVTDVWRLGAQAFAVLGIEYKIEQVVLIKKFFDRIAIVFDGDRQAQRQARELSSRLDAMGVDTFIYKLDKGVDPGSMSDDDAKHLVKTLQTPR